MVVGIGCYLVWLWQPERQVQLHTTHFLKNVERRNWDSIAAFIAPDFHDRWGHQKATALADGREVFRQFLFLTVESRVDSVSVTGHTVSARTYIRMQGNGGPFAQIITDRLNTLKEPFVLTWRRGSWKPWDWQLVELDQRELQFQAGSWE